MQLKICLVAFLVGCLEAVPLKEEGQHVSSTTSPPLPPPCSSAACKETAKNFIDSMNSSANPCDDFWEFTCGAWHKRTIPDDQAQVWLFTEMGDKLNGQIRELLTKYSVETDGKKNSRAVTLAASVYQKCMKLGDNDQEGTRHIKELVDEVIGSWTIGQKVDAGSHVNSKATWQQILVQAMVKANLQHVLLFGLYPDSKNSSINDLWFSHSPLGLEDSQLRNISANVPLITAYKEYIRSSAKLFCDSNCPNLEADIDAIVHLESELAQAKLPLEVSRDPANSELKLTLKEFSARTKFNWLSEVIEPLYRALNVSSEYLPTDSQGVIINDIGFITKMVTILGKTSPQTVANLIGWRIVETNGPQASELFRRHSAAFEKVHLGLKKMPPRTSACFYQVNGKLGYAQMNMATSRLWIDYYFSPKDKVESEHIVESIQRTFGHLLLDNAWMADETTRFAALKKLASIRRKVGYTEPLLNNSYLDYVYNLNGNSQAEFDALLNEKNYFKAFWHMGVNGFRESLKLLKAPSILNEDLWLISPATINAIYFYKDNSITIPAGFLKMPNFDVTRPHSLNFGAIGSVVGHEISHGFDDAGRNYDESGNLRNWWSNATLKEYKRRGSCLEKQYSSMVEPVTGLHVNGKSGLGENTADNGGVHTSHEAFKARQLTDPSPRLADLPQYSPEQLFFLSWGNVWCGVARPEVLRKNIQNDAHAPVRFRANVPLMNLPAFAEAFKCPLGSKMNPKEKCTVW